jgi:hypothetical protein
LLFGTGLVFAGTGHGDLAGAGCRFFNRIAFLDITGSVPAFDSVDRAYQRFKTAA